ncbi:MAG: T9SS C-terminal target domain-containing protein [Cytophagia bacterium]|nr:T9SS C-terminal target domain-containing protein [Cytophagia bacterium]
MKKYLFLIALMSICIVNAQNITQTEIVGRPTNNSITIQAFFDAAVQVSIQYGTVSGTYPNQTQWQSFAVNDPAEVVISGLSPNTKYYYKLNYRAPNATTFTSRPEHFFQTQRPAGSSFSFVVQADPHMDEQSSLPIYDRCLQNQLEDNPDFMIDLGDFLMTDKLKNLRTNQIPRDTIPYRCRLLRNKYEAICHSVPLFISLGNHEGEAGWNLNGTADNIAVWGTNDRKKYFLNPAPDNSFYTGDNTNHSLVGIRENYYAWTWGDALFIVLDPYWYTALKPDAANGWRWTLGKTQYDWLKSTLEGSKAKFKFVFAHQLIGGDPNGRGGIEFANLYEWGGSNLNGTSGFAANRPGWYKPIKDLLTENRVNIFFHGHDHFFMKQEMDCLVYQETPQPSHPNFSSAGQAAEYGYIKGDLWPNSGHIRVNVGPNGVQVDYVRAYLPKNETNARHNQDVSASYLIGKVNCYDNAKNNPIVLLNSEYKSDWVGPNPMNDLTKFVLHIEKPETISLTIYNVLGQKVKDLLTDFQASIGNFEVLWNGQDDHGSTLPSGSYVYQINGSAHGNSTGKILIDHK